MQKNAIKKDLAEIFRDDDFDIDTQFASKSLEIYEYLIDKRVMKDFESFIDSLSKLISAQ